MNLYEKSENKPRKQIQMKTENFDQHTVGKSTKIFVIFDCICMINIKKD